MPHRFGLISLLVIFGLGSTLQPAFGQALIPHVPQLSGPQLEREGLSLAQEAAQLAQFQQFELALARAQLATQLAPQAYETWTVLGALYLEMKQPGKSVTALERARSLEKQNPTILFSLGSAYFQQGNYLAAARTLQTGLALKPNAPEALFDLGNTYYKMGQFKDAIVQYDKAVTQDRKFWPAINNIGLVQYEAKNVKAAVQKWQAAIAIDNKASEPKLALAVALYAGGQQTQGLTLAETALKLDGRYADLNFLKENLWGDRLLTDTKKVLATPRIQAAIAQLDAPRPGPSTSPR